MFDHVKFGVSDFAASKAFFLKALEPLGVAVVAEGAPTYGVELCRKGNVSSLVLYQTEEKPAHLHLAFTAENREQVEAFYRAALEAGGLMYYGPSSMESARQAASFVDKILKGAKPGELPFEAPTGLHLKINANAAKKMGLAVPASILMQADLVIR